MSDTASELPRPAGEADSVSVDHGSHMATLVLTPRPLPLRALVIEIWRARGLTLALGRQEFQVRYRRARLGVLWAVGMPLLQAVVLAIIFGNIVRFKTSIPYLTYVLTGLTAFSFFSGTVAAASTAIVDASGMASKIYFPRAVLPLIKVVSSTVGLGIGVVMMTTVALLQGVRPGLEILLVIPALLLLVLLTASLSLLLSALHVYFRDVRFVVQAALTLWFYATPVFYPVVILPRYVRLALQANPLVGIIELIRVGFGAPDPGWQHSLLGTVVWVVLLCIAAAWIHRRYDRVFSDRL